MILHNDLHQEQIIIRVYIKYVHILIEMTVVKNGDDLNILKNEKYISVIIQVSYRQWTKK